MLTILLVISSFWALVVWVLLKYSFSSRNSKSQNGECSKKRVNSSDSEILKQEKCQTCVVKLNDGETHNPNEKKENRKNYSRQRCPSLPKKDVLCKNQSENIRNDLYGSASKEIKPHKSSSDSYIPSRLGSKSASRPSSNPSDFDPKGRCSRDRKISRKCITSVRSVSPPCSERTISRTTDYIINRGESHDSKIHSFSPMDLQFQTASRLLSDDEDGQARGRSLKRERVNSGVGVKVGAIEARRQSLKRDLDELQNIERSLERTRDESPVKEMREDAHRGRTLKKKELEDVSSRSRQAKRETKREKLLRKRRRIISQLQERDIDELLRVYFFCDSPIEDFEFATPQNIDEKIRIPSVRYSRRIKADENVRNEVGNSNENRILENTNSERRDKNFETEEETKSGRKLLRRSSSSRSRNSSPNDDLERTYKVYEELKQAGHINLAGRVVDSHIPSFFDLDQPRKRSWSLVIYDRNKNCKTYRGNVGKDGRRRVSKSNEEKVGVPQPTIFGTVADDLSPRDNTKRGFPQSSSKGAKGGLDLEGSNHPLPEWALAEDDDNSLVYEEGVLVSGCLSALVLHATPTPTYYPDAAYLFAFLLSARLFIKPHELLQKICSLGFAQQGLVNDDINTINRDELGNFVPHMVQLLGEWSETFPYDFRDERMMVGVRTMTHRCIALQPSLRRDVTQVLHNLLNKLTQLERYEESLAKLTVPPPADFLPTVPDITEACPSALVLAQQLTHIELERLCYIGPEEFVQAFAKDNLESTYKDLKKTNNLESYVQWFNRLSYLVATQACFPVKKKQRIRVIEMWIEVARECFNIGNFNSLMGVIAGLNMSPVARLKKTWSKVQTAKFSVLEHQMDPSSNFSSYRSTLKAAMWRSAGAVDERQKIVIPFFSLLVKDLYFLNEGCANRLPNGHINFDKFWQLAKQVTEFMAWKQVNCPFEKDPQILQYLQTTPVLSETGLALASFEGEGPENSYEKERFKALKAEMQQQQHSHPQQSN